MTENTPPLDDYIPNENKEFDQSKFYDAESLEPWEQVRIGRADVLKFTDEEKQQLQETFLTLYSFSDVLPVRIGNEFRKMVERINFNKGESIYQFISFTLKKLEERTHKEADDVIWKIILSRNDQNVTDEKLIELFKELTPPIPEETGVNWNQINQVLEKVKKAGTLALVITFLMIAGITTAGLVDSFSSGWMDSPERQKSLAVRDQYTTIEEWLLNGRENKPLMAQGNERVRVYIAGLADSYQRGDISAAEIISWLTELAKLNGYDATPEGVQQLVGADFAPDTDTRYEEPATRTYDEIRAQLATIAQSEGQTPAQWVAAHSG